MRIIKPNKLNNVLISIVTIWSFLFVNLAWAGDIAETSQLRPLALAEKYIAKEPWEMTRGEFNSEIVFHGAPKEETEGIRRVSRVYGGGSDFTEDFNLASGYAKRPIPGLETGVVFYARRRDVGLPPKGTYTDAGNTLLTEANQETKARGGKVLGELPPFTKDPYMFILKQAAAEGKIQEDKIRLEVISEGATSEIESSVLRPLATGERHIDEQLPVKPARGIILEKAQRILTVVRNKFRKYRFAASHAEIDLAKALFEKGDYQGAILICEIIFERDPSDYEALGLMIDARAGAEPSFRRQQAKRLKDWGEFIAQYASDIKKRFYEGQIDYRYAVEILNDRGRELFSEQKVLQKEYRDFPDVYEEYFFTKPSLAILDTVEDLTRSSIENIKRAIAHSDDQTAISLCDEILQCYPGHGGVRWLRNKATELKAISEGIALGIESNV